MHGETIKIKYQCPVLAERVRVLGLSFGTDTCLTSHTHVIIICCVTIISQTSFMSCVSISFITGRHY